MKKRFASLFIFFLVIALSSVQVFAHSGRTDGSGGHHDNYNASGLGSYHYHHGMSAHLHPNGLCPYSQNTATRITSSPPKDTIKVSNMPAKLYNGETRILDWTLSSNSDLDNVKWSSSDQSVISVNVKGVLTALKPGKATITATLSNSTRNFNITIIEIKASKIEISEKPMELEIDVRKLMFARFEPRNTYIKTIEWSSSDIDIASISKKGYLSTHKVGTTMISAMASNGVSDQFELIVIELKPKKIETNVENLKLIIGENSKIEAHVLPEGATNNTITWSVDDSGIIKVDHEGNITTQGVGKTSVILKCQDITKEIPVEVIAINATNMDVNLDKIPYMVGNIIDVGELFIPVITILPENATDKSYELFTRSPEVLEIHGNSVEVIGSGNAILNIKSGGISKEILFKAIDLNAILMNTGIVSFFVIIGIVLIVLKKKRHKIEMV